MADFYGKETSKNLRKLRQMAPEAFKGFLDFDQMVFKDGAIPSKTKELMAITAAHVTQCPWCIEAHVSRAKEKGCSDEEIAEAVWVAAAMRAGAAFSHGAIAMAVTEEHKHQGRALLARASRVGQHRQDGASNGGPQDPRCPDWRRNCRRR